MGRSREGLADSLGQFVATVTAGMLPQLAECSSQQHSQVKVVTQIESITEKLQLLTENVGKLEERSFFKMAASLETT